jgi:subtilisin family serine protease
MGGIVIVEQLRNQARIDKARGQADHITKAFNAEKITIVTGYGDDGEVEFMHAADHILVRDSYLAEIQAILGQPEGFAHVTRVIEGVVALSFVAAKRNPRLKVRAGRQPTVTEAVEASDAEFGEGIATPDQVLTVDPGVPCPATEPEEAYADIEPYPGICTENSGEGVVVYVADTGLLRDAASTHPWLAGVRRAHKPDGQLQDWDPDRWNDPADGVSRIPPYCGHGTFVAGVIRCEAPRAEVIVARIFRFAGSSLESHFVRELQVALRIGVDVFNLSISALTRHSRPLMAFERWLRLLDQYKGVVCVVAAGNSGSHRWSWPAAFPTMVGVGALAANWRDRARFSNYGGWVDVYAPGRDLINAYATGPYRCHDAPYANDIRHFYGMARWSGTSFSTPIVAGLIAARMWRTGENGQEAAAGLLAEARSHAIPGVGAILLPCGHRSGHMRE